MHKKLYCFLFYVTGSEIQTFGRICTGKCKGRRNEDTTHASAFTTVYSLHILPVVANGDMLCELQL